MPAQVERHHIPGSPEMVRLCAASKLLYNRCNFMIRAAWFKKTDIPDLLTLTRCLGSDASFKALHNTKTAKQTIRRCLIDWTNFKKAARAYRNDTSKFIRCPKPPGYKHKLAQVTFYEETVRQKPRRAGILTPTNDLFRLRSDRKFLQVVVTPKTFGFIIDVQYEAEENPKPKTSKDKVCCIDLGLNNLCAITSDQHHPVLINGRIVKSINRQYNKRPCKKNSRKRYFRIENYFHHVSRLVIDNCAQHGIGRIIIGCNVGWKAGLNIGKVNTQNFISVPFSLLLQKLQYKASAAGIDVVYTEEAYTSQSSYLGRDPLPAYVKGTPAPAFTGKREQRGLYRTGTGQLLNADVNGSANIGRKVIQDEDILLRLDRSLAARPVLINPLKAFGSGAIQIKPLAVA
jgi:IS605 OrfB family transposase